MAAGDLALALATSVISATDMESVHPEHAATKACQGRLLSCRKLTSSASSHAPVLCQSRKSATTPIGSNHSPTANAHYCHLKAAQMTGRNLDGEGNVFEIRANPLDEGEIVRGRLKPPVG
jgi:hypothetical protein